MLHCHWTIKQLELALFTKSQNYWANKEANKKEEILQRAAGLLASVQALPRDNVSQKYVILYLPTLYESLAYKPPHNNDLKDW